MSPAGDRPARRPAPRTARHPLLRLLLHAWPVLLIVAAGMAIHFSGLSHLLSLQALATRRIELDRIVGTYPAAACAAFVAATALFLSLSLPGEGILTAAGGLVFGIVVGSALSVAGTVLAAVLLFLAIRHSFAEQLDRPRGPFVERVRHQLHRDGISYMLTLRLLPVLPFTLVSVLAVLVRMSLPAFLLSTTVGVIPPTVIFAVAGHGLAHLLDQHRPLTLTSVFSPMILLPLIALALLALLPIAWRRLGRHRRGPDHYPPEPPGSDGRAATPGPDDVDRVR